MRVFNENFFQSHYQTGLACLKNNFKISLKTSHFTGQNSPFQTSQGSRGDRTENIFLSKIANNLHTSYSERIFQKNPILLKIFLIFNECKARKAHRQRLAKLRQHALNITLILGTKVHKSANIHLKNEKYTSSAFRQC